MVDRVKSGSAAYLRASKHEIPASLLVNGQAVKCGQMPGNLITEELSAFSGAAWGGTAASLLVELRDLDDDSVIATLATLDVLNGARKSGDLTDIEIVTEATELTVTPTFDGTAPDVGLYVRFLTTDLADVSME